MARVSVDPHLVDAAVLAAPDGPLHLDAGRRRSGTERPTVFVHLLDRKGKVARTFDHPFPGAWQEGVPVAYDLKLYQSALAAPLAPGAYQVTAGLYGKDGKRWPLEAGEPVGRDEYKAFQVEVPPPGAGPRFAYSGAWLERAGGRPPGARPALAGGGGPIRLVDQRGPGSVWLVLQIPDGMAEG